METRSTESYELLTRCEVGRWSVGIVLK